MLHNKTINKFQFFPFHLVDPSPWPILLSFSLLNLTIGAVAYMHGFSYGGYILILGFILITYGHHALIDGNRISAIDGVIFTIILAIIFTGLQYFEYSEAGFTMSDGVYGSAFYASTGLHGLTIIVPIKFINKNIYMNKSKDKPLIKIPNNRNFIKKI